MTLHDRLNPRLLDETAQPQQHGETKYRDGADPSHLCDSLSGFGFDA